MKHLFKALADFQQEVPVIHKGTQGYGYQFADLPKIFEVINPLLQKHGLGFTQLVNDNSIKTVLFHVESGEMIDSITHVPFDSIVYENVIKIDRQGNEINTSVIRGFEGMNRAQAIGSMITYFRRYSLSAMLGLVTDKDTDGTSVKQKDEPKKEKLDSKRFQNALNSINEGTIINGKKLTKEFLLANFDLTNEQKEML